jgi:hypothetical protein
MAIPTPITTVIAKSTARFGPKPRKAPPAAIRRRPKRTARRAPIREMRSEPSRVAVASSRIGREGRAPTALSLRDRLRWICGSSGGTASSVSRTQLPTSQRRPIR